MRKLILIPLLALITLSCKEKEIEYAEEQPMFLGSVVGITEQGCFLDELGEVSLADSLVLADSIAKNHEKSDSILASVFIISSAQVDTAITLFNTK